MNVVHLIYNQEIICSLAKFTAEDCDGCRKLSDSYSRDTNEAINSLWNKRFSAVLAEYISGCPDRIIEDFGFFTMKEYAIDIVVAGDTYIAVSIQKCP